MEFVLDEIIIDNEKQQKEVYNDNDKTYISLKDYQNKQQQVSLKNKIIPSKVLIIENLSITIMQDLNDNFEFKIDTECGVLSDRMTIPKLNINAKEEVVFDDNITLSKLESIIRRCGILEEYNEFLSNDPEIIINSYTLNIHKDYRFFNEFKEGVLIGEEIFM